MLKIFDKSLVIVQLCCTIIVAFRGGERFQIALVFLIDLMLSPLNN